MSAIPWTVRKQLTYILFILFLVAGGAFIIFFMATKPTCFDGKQNQDEDGIDCGGVCAERCLGEIKDMIVLWSRAVRTADETYDAIALIDNINLSLGANAVRYRFKVYDQKNVLIAVKEGQTFVNPGEKFAIFEPNLDTGLRTPARTFIEFQTDIPWELVEQKPHSLLVSKKEFTNTDFPRLHISLSNNSVIPTQNIFAVAVLYDEDENIKGASATRIDSVEGNSSQDITFTWPRQFIEILDGETWKPATSEIFLRTYESFR